MTIKEEKMDLFNVPQGYYLAHCITGDFSLGAGVAKRMDEVYDMKNKLHNSYGRYDDYEGKDRLYLGMALVVDNVFNLVTKKYPWKKAKYKRLKSALEYMRDIMEEKYIKKVAMPRIGCGHDKLEWDKVKDIIEEVFENTDIEILICTL